MPRYIVTLNNGERIVVELPKRITPPHREQRAVWNQVPWQEQRKGFARAELALTGEPIGYNNAQPERASGVIAG
jgi:hypothetical protein